MATYVYFFWIYVYLIHINMCWLLFIQICVGCYSYMKGLSFSKMISKTIRFTEEVLVKICVYFLRSKIIYNICKYQTQMDTRLCQGVSNMPFFWLEKYSTHHSITLHEYH